MSNIADLSARDLAVAIRNRAVSPVEAVEAALRRIRERSDLKAFLTVCDERALAEARQAEADIKAGAPIKPLHGIPFSAKDVTNTAGVSTTHGCAALAGTVPNEDAVAVARMRAAGAILIGKTATPEFGHKPFTETPFYGRTLNPWNVERTCGGSSGGAAVAVLTGMGPIALGTDGGGSNRIPAACCGVVGFKATLGMVPNLQVPDLFGAGSYVGPLARTVADAVTVFDVIHGPDRHDPWGQVAPQTARRLGSTERPRIGLFMRCGNILDSEVDSAVQAAMRVAEATGMVIEPIDIDFVALEETFLVNLRAHLAARVGKMVSANPERFDPSLIATVAAARNHTAADLAAAQAVRSDCFTNVQRLFERFDILASPTLSAPALPVGVDPLGHVQIAGRDAGTIRAAWYPYTYPFNLTGHPALSMPCGLSRDGLPIGLQLVGRWNDDRFLLDIALRLEDAAIGAECRRPPVQRTSSLPHPDQRTDAGAAAGRGIARH